MEQLTAEMVRSLSQQYLNNLHRVQAEHDIDNLTRRDMEKSITTAQVTAEVCLNLLDSLIISRYDYLIKQEVERQVEKKLADRVAAMTTAARNMSRRGVNKNYGAGV